MTRNLGFDVNVGGTRLVIVQTVFLALAWLVCMLRFQVKIFITKKILVDDWLMLAALLLYTTYGIIAIHGVAAGGTGKPTYELTVDGIIIALRAWYLCEVLYAPMSALIRTSIALFLLRLAVKAWHRWVIKANLVVIWVVSIIYFLLMTLQCVPPDQFWEGPVHAPGATGSCIDHNVVPIATFVHSTISAVSDWCLGLLPIAMLWHVDINRRTKISIAILLGMGLIAGTALIIRIPFVKKIAISADFLQATIWVAIWSVIEPSLGIVAGCVASIRPLFKTWGFGLNRSRRTASKRNQSSTGGAASEAHSHPRWCFPRNKKMLQNEKDVSHRTEPKPDPMQPADPGSLLSCSSDLELKAFETVSDRRDVEGMDAKLLEAERDEAPVKGSSDFLRQINVRTSIDVHSTRDLDRWRWSEKNHQPQTV